MQLATSYSVLIREFGSFRYVGSSKVIEHITRDGRIPLCGRRGTNSSGSHWRHEAERNYVLRDFCCRFCLAKYEKGA